MGNLHIGKGGRIRPTAAFLSRRSKIVFKPLFVVYAEDINGAVKIEIWTNYRYIWS